MSYNLTFASFENERNTFPSRIVDPEGGGSVCGAVRVRRHGVIVEIAGFAIRTDILAKQGIVAFDGGNGA